MADVSQFIQMRRLGSLQARQPKKQDKSVTHLYQIQVTTSGIREFLPNPKTKFVSGNQVETFLYNPGKQAKPKTLPRNAF
jgi:hypothetical protein